jgi:hypothetical protein
MRLPVTFWSSQLAPDAIRGTPTPRLTEEIDNPVRITKLVGFDKHASEREQFVLVRPPLSSTTTPMSERDIT